MDQNKRDFILHLIAITSLTFIIVLVIIVETVYKTEITDVSLIIGSLATVATGHTFRAIGNRSKD